MKSMRVILREDIKGLGKKGDQVEVAEGYGRNYLIPRNLAEAVTAGRLREKELVHASQTRREAREREQAEELARKLEGLTVTITGRAGEGGKLYGAVTSRDIAAGVEAVLHRTLDKRKIELAEPIKTLGTYPVTVRLYPGISAGIKVAVVAQEA